MNHSRGFIFVFGTRTLSTKQGPPTPAVCPQCRQTADFQNKTARRWFTLFFIPIFPIDAGRPYTQCSNCQMRFATTSETIGKRATVSQGRQLQQAVQLYNRMRASPANSVTLHELLDLYLTLEEYDQAVSAAREFQQALNASEQCMTTFGRVLIQQHNFAEAIKWLDAALARNPQGGETNYFKAVAMMDQTPPDYPAAAAAARLARAANYPQSDALIAEIDEKSRAASA
jgi:tetratricopeptide (TPR) repeat protein